MEFLRGNACFHKGKTMDFPLRKEDLPIFYLHCIGVKENKIWVAMSVGTLVTNEGRMLGCIQEKLVVSYVLIWDHDQPVVGSTILLQ
jgi:hypothetical protein